MSYRRPPRLITLYCTGTETSLSCDYAVSQRHSENMQQIYRRTPMSKCDFNKVAKQHMQSNFIETALRYGCSPVNLWHIFRTPFPNNTSGQLLLNECRESQFHHLAPMIPLIHLYVPHQFGLSLEEHFNPISFQELLWPKY